MEEYTDELSARYPALKEVIPALKEWISEAVSLYRNSGTLFVAGNGGSAADAEHICGELLKGFLSRRSLSDAEVTALAEAGDTDGLLGRSLQGGLRSISLLSHPAFSSAFANDVNPELIFAQQLWALGKPGDMFVGISTGGGAANIYQAFIAARAKKIRTVLLTGNRHGRCESLADIVLAVPESATYRIQELHLPLYHTFCRTVEAHFFTPME